MKKKVTIIAVVLSVLVVTAFITNPSKSDYVSWVKEREMNRAKNVIEYYAISTLGNSILTTTTEQSDYLIFSVFTTKFDDEEYKILGIFKKFIPLNYKEIKNSEFESEV